MKEVGSSCHVGGKSGTSEGRDWLHMVGWFLWLPNLVSLLCKLLNHIHLMISLLNQSKVLNMGKNISQCLIFKCSWFALAHGYLHRNAAVCSKSIPSFTFFSTGKGENWRPIHKLSYIFTNSGSCHFLAAYYFEESCPQESAVSDIKSECLYLGIASVVTLATSCFTSPAKLLQLWLDWTRSTINVTLSRSVLYFLKTLLPGKLPSNYWKKIATREYVRSGYLSVSEKKKID